MTKLIAPMPVRQNMKLRIGVSVLLALCADQAFALCNGGTTVNSTLTVSASCDGANVKGLTLDTGAAVTINSGVTVSNDAPFGVNGRSVVVLSSATSSSLVNNGFIFTNNQWGLWVQSGGNVDVLNSSSGEMRGVVRYGISNQGTIGTLTNVGSIRGGFGSIGNAGVAGITVFNNLQGAQAASPITLVGNLPVNYNIIVNSTSDYGQLAAPGAAGNMRFNIYGNTGTTLVPGVNASVVAAGRYVNVLQGFTSLANVTGTTGSYAGFNYSLVANASVLNAWDLLFVLAAPSVPPGPSASDTQASIHSLAPGLRNIFNTQAVATNFANMNTYDCNLFDTKGVCVSVGGQQTHVDNPNSSTTSAVLVGGYRISPAWRIGGFLNKDIQNNTVSNIRISNTNPLMGFFAVWNQSENHLGYQVKIANAYQDKRVTTTRAITGTSEAGTGSTSINTQSYVGELSYAILANQDKTLVHPYAALRHTKIRQGAYTEDASVTAPLSYAALEDRSMTALVGVKLDHKLTDKVNLTASLGIEHDISHSVDNLTASGVSGLTSENFNDSITRTRPVATLGAYFSPARNQRIAAEIYYQQLPFQSTGSATAYVHYTIGF
ncbi:MAG: autotransporter outer membrane beta-barrel domain-containing protein [Proteobacteria bacterium]|nr:autotransporter outer membrane beta-barrel domain-containing protein [Pseudomonadota bacterium]